MEVFSLFQLLLKAALEAARKHAPPIMLNITMENGQEIKNTCLMQIVFNNGNTTILTGLPEDKRPSYSIRLKECRFIDVKI